MDISFAVTDKPPRPTFKINEGVTVDDYYIHCSMDSYYVRLLNETSLDYLVKQGLDIKKYGPKIYLHCLANDHIQIILLQYGIHFDSIVCNKIFYLPFHHIKMLIFYGFNPNKKINGTKITFGYCNTEELDFIYKWANQIKSTIEKAKDLAYHKKYTEAYTEYISAAHSVKKYNCYNGTHCINSICSNHYREQIIYLRKKAIEIISKLDIFMTVDDKMKIFESNLKIFKSEEKMKIHNEQTLDLLLKSFDDVIGNTKKYNEKINSATGEISKIIKTKSLILNEGNPTKSKQYLSKLASYFNYLSDLSQKEGLIEESKNLDKQVLSLLGSLKN